MRASRLATILATLLILSIGASAQASDRLTRLKVVVGMTTPDAGASKNDAKRADLNFRRKKQILQETRDRIEKRLDAAEVKHGVVQVSKDGTIAIELREKRERGWYLGLLVSPGKFEIREHRPGDIDWTELTSILPTGAELRSGDESTVAHVWSADRDGLQELAKRVHIPGHAVVVGPADNGGWRTYTMGVVVATQTDIKVANRQLSKTGIPFISLQLEESIGDRLAHFQGSKVQTMGVILDGEVLGLVSKSALERKRILLSTPGRFATRDAQLAWVSQVTGRLAAYLPIPIGVLEE